jgi:hypothetical protein
VGKLQELSRLKLSQVIFVTDYEPIQVNVFSRFLGLFERKFAKNPQKSDETVLLG